MDDIKYFNGYLDPSEDEVYILTPGGDTEVYHQYGGLACNQFEGKYIVKKMEDKELAKKLCDLNDKVCDSGWGNDMPHAVGVKFEELLQQLIGPRSCEGLIELADSYLVMQSCD